MIFATLSIPSLLNFGAEQWPFRTLRSVISLNLPPFFGTQDIGETQNGLSGVLDIYPRLDKVLTSSVIKLDSRNPMILFLNIKDSGLEENETLTPSKIILCTYSEALIVFQL